MSEWTVVVPPDIEKKIRSIPEPDKGRILRALNAMHDGLAGDIKPLTGRPDWRLRVGKWRILLNVNIQAQTVLVLFVASRGDVYKK